MEKAMEFHPCPDLISPSPSSSSSISSNSHQSDMREVPEDSAPLIFQKTFLKKKLSQRFLGEENLVRDRLEGAVDPLTCVQIHQDEHEAPARTLSKKDLFTQLSQKTLADKNGLKKRRRTSSVLTKVIHPIKRFLQESKEMLSSYDSQPTHSDLNLNLGLYQGNVKEKYGQPVKLLGKGATATVHLVRNYSQTNSQTQDYQHYAVKEFKVAHNQSKFYEEFRKTLKEFSILNQLDHPNIIQTYDLLLDNKHAYIVMEYLPKDLFSLITTKSVDTVRKHQYFLQLLDGVHYLHSNGIIHRDLKLENCLIDHQGNLKIIDFGSSHQLSLPLNSSLQGYLVDGLIGSDPYMAPEIFLKKFYNPFRIDIWSIGIIYLSMLIGSFPWTIASIDRDLRYEEFAFNSSQFLKKLLSGEIIDFLSLLLNVDDDLRPCDINCISSHPYVSRLRQFIDKIVS